MPPASPDPACARSLSACGVPCRGGATARSARTGSGIQCRIPPRSTRPPRGSCGAGFRRSRLSACPVAPPSAGSCRLHGRSSPDPRSRRPDTVGTRAGLCRRPATTLQRSPDSSVRCPAAPERWHGGPGDARRNRRGPDQSGRVAIRCPGSQGGSWMKQNRLNGRWQGDFSDFRRVGVYARRFRGNIQVTAADGEMRTAAAWVGRGGRARVLRDALVTAERYQVGTVLCVQDKAMQQAWCLATSSTDQSAKALISLYGKRWSIECGFRDTKDLRFGMGMRSIHVSTPARRDRLWLLNAFAIMLLTLLGAAGEALGYDRYLKSNTTKRRTHSLFRQGCMLYDLMPNMPQARLLPLIERFTAMLAELPVFAATFGVV